MYSNIWRKKAHGIGKHIVCLCPCVCVCASVCMSISKHQRFIFVFVTCEEKWMTKYIQMSIYFFGNVFIMNVRLYIKWIARSTDWLTTNRKRYMCVSSRERGCISCMEHICAEITGKESNNNTNKLTRTRTRTHTHTWMHRKSSYRNWTRVSESCFVAVRPVPVCAHTHTFAHTPCMHACIVCCCCYRIFTNNFDELHYYFSRTQMERCWIADRMR